MATISSPGIASGLDVQGIVKQLVALEKSALKPLQTQATSIQTKLSTFGSIKSQVSALGDAAAKLSTATGWNSVTASSSDTSAVGVTASAGAPTTALTLEVQNLAKAQATASTALLTGSAVGTGSLTIELGNWSTGTFAPGAAAAVTLTIEPGKDSLSEIAAQINKAGAGVSAMVLKDDSGERLLLRSSATGEPNGFRITATDDDSDNNDANGLSRLAYNPGTATGMGLSQAGENAIAKVNNVTITSASNTLSDTLPGLTITLSKVTTAPVEISVKNDDEAVRKNVQAFVSAYNTLTATLATATRYDAASKTAGPLQGDSTAVGLQNALRNMMRSITPGGAFTRLVDVGVEAKTGGALEINAEKLTAALSNREALQGLFTTAGTDATTRGFGLKVKAFADGLLATDGLVSTKTTSLQSAITRNTREQDKVNERAARTEVRLLAQYNAMDAAVGRFNSLGAFVTQQITLWNQSTR
jgi:flagellar hook-associated protein 2